MLAILAFVSIQVQASPRRKPPPGPPFRRPPRQNCICPAIFQPVCGVNGRTYSNACQAKCARVRIRHRGPCKRRRRK